ncbi:MAG: exo-beta-N-acetylmuramidase NamZ family protein [Candidatus Sumerlaeaceae bacterium]
MIALKCVVAALVLSICPAASFARDVKQQLDALVEMAHGKRLGLITNPSGCDETGRPDVEYLLNNAGTTITAFFAPEHGFRGILPAGRGDKDYVDPNTSIPVVAVYGPRKAPTPQQLANVDILVFDMQDVGARFYTFTWTMTLCMEAAAQAGKKFVVIDRPNPVGGIKVEGPANEKDHGLIGRVIPSAGIGVTTRHGMTVGEIAKMWNSEAMNPRVELTVLKMAAWKRGQLWKDTGRKYLPPSPNMRTPEAALVYSGTCIFEGSKLSEGRGTVKPFEMIGAPFVNPEQYANALTSAALPGVKFSPVRYTPTTSKHKNVECGGVELAVTDTQSFKPVQTGLVMLQTALKRYPDDMKSTASATRLSGIPELESRLRSESVDQILQSAEPSRQRFLAIRKKYLLYPE